MNTKDFFSKYGIYIILIIALIIYSHFLFSKPLILWDEAVYLSNAKSHISTSYFQEDFRFPLLEYVIGGTWMVTGESVIIAQILMILISLLSVVGVYLLSRLYFKDELWIILSTSLFAFAPIMIFWSFRIYTDIPAMCAMIFSVYFFIKYFKQKLIKNLIFSGVLASVSFLFRFPIIIFVLPLIAYLLFHKKWKELIIFAISGLIPLIPWLVYNQIKYANPIWDLLAQGLAVNKYTAWQPIKKLLIATLKNIHILIIGLVAGIIALIKKIKDEKNNILLGIFILITAFYFFIVRLKFERYILSFLPFLIIISIMGFQYLLSKVPKKTRFIITFALILIIIFLSIFFIQEKISFFHKEEICKKATQESIKFIQKTIPSGEMIVSNQWPWYAYYGNHNVSSTWTSNISLIIEKNNPSIFVINKWGGFQENIQNYDTDPNLIKISSFIDSCNQKITIYALNKNKSSIYNKFYKNK